MKKIIFFGICFFILMDCSWALTMSCPEVASPGEEVKIHLEEDAVNGIKAKYKFASEFVYQDMVLNSAWKSYYDGVDGFSAGNVSSKDKLIMDINLKVAMDVKLNEEYLLELIDIEGNDSNDKSIKLDNVSCKVKVLSNVDTLDSLVVEGVDLSPKFDKNTFSYKASTKADKIVIKATASDKSATVEGDLGEKKLNFGVNTFVVRVISTRGSIREYKIYITRNVDKKSNDVTLKSLTLSTGKIDLKKDTFLYNVDVLYEVEEIEVEAIANDKKAKVEIQKSDKLVVGENRIKIIVTAEDGTKANYEVIVNRKDKLSDNATIKNLIIKNYDINFDSEVYEYELEIDSEDKLDIEVILSDDKATYKINGNKNLKDSSIIDIEVTAENGNTLVYKIKIRKLSEDSSKSLISYISMLPLIGFIVLTIGVLIVKIVKSIIYKRK